MFKKPILLISVFVIVNISNAQFYKSLNSSPEFNTALEKIVGDFRYNFKNISGNTVSDDPEVDTYESTIKLPGATNCVINKYHSVKDTTASWQATLYQGEDYKEAIKVYKNTFRQINKSRMQLIDKSTAGFYGELQEPKEETRFAESTLQLDIADERYKRFKAEVELQSTYTGWQVNVYFHNKKPDEEMN